MPRSFSLVNDNKSGLFKIASFQFIPLFTAQWMNFRWKWLRHMILFSNIWRWFPVENWSTQSMNNDVSTSHSPQKCVDVEIHSHADKDDHGHRAIGWILNNIFFSSILLCYDLWVHMFQLGVTKAKKKIITKIWITNSFALTLISRAINLEQLIDGKTFNGF